MKVVGDFVGVGADERALDLVDSAVEIFERHVSELVGKIAPKLRIEVLPEGAAAPDHVLPQP
jgi:hypothetical protein